MSHKNASRRVVVKQPHAKPARTLTVDKLLASMEETAECLMLYQTMCAWLMKRVRAGDVDMMRRVSQMACFSWDKEE